MEQTTSNTNDNEEKYEARIHDNWLATYLHYTSSQESPENFHLWTGISLIAAALDRDVYIERGYGRLFPNLYIVLISPSGRSKKTKCVTTGVPFLYKTDGIRILTDKFTPEGLIEYLAIAPMRKTGSVREQMCTCFIFASELSVLFGNQSYTIGLIDTLTALYDSPEIFEYTPKHALVKNKRGIRVTNVNVNLLGASNPEWLAKGFQEDSFGGGFMGRTIFVYSTETRRSDRSAWMELDDSMKGLDVTLLRDLQKISKLRGAFKVEKEAYDFYKKYYLEYDGNYSGRMGGYFQRKPTHLLKLAMILSVNFDDSLIITLNHMEAALKLLDSVEKDMPEAFVYVSATSEARIAQYVIESMRNSSGIGYRKGLFKHVRHLLRNVREFDDVMENLSEAGIVERVMIKDQPGFILAAVRKQVEKEMEKQKTEKQSEET